MKRRRFQLVILLVLATLSSLSYRLHVPSIFIVRKLSKYLPDPTRKATSLSAKKWNWKGKSKKEKPTPIESPEPPIEEKEVKTLGDDLFAHFDTEAERSGDRVEIAESVSNNYEGSLAPRKSTFTQEFNPQWYILFVHKDKTENVRSIVRSRADAPDTVLHNNLLDTYVFRSKMAVESKNKDVVRVRTFTPKAYRDRVFLYLRFMNETVDQELRSIPGVKMVGFLSKGESDSLDEDIRDNLQQQSTVSFSDFRNPATKKELDEHRFAVGERIKVRLNDGTESHGEISSILSHDMYEITFDSAQKEIIHRSRIEKGTIPKDAGRMANELEGLDGDTITYADLKGHKKYFATEEEARVRDIVVRPDWMSGQDVLYRVVKPFIGEKPVEPGPEPEPLAEVFEEKPPRWDPHWPRMSQYQTREEFFSALRRYRKERSKRKANALTGVIDPFNVTNFDDYLQLIRQLEQTVDEQQPVVRRLSEESEEKKAVDRPPPSELDEEERAELERPEQDKPTKPTGTSEPSEPPPSEPTAAPPPPTTNGTSGEDEDDPEMELVRRHLRTPYSKESAQALGQFYAYPDPRDYDRFFDFWYGMERKRLKRIRAKDFITDVELEDQDDLDDRKWDSCYYTAFNPNPVLMEQKVRTSKNVFINALRKMMVVTKNRLAEVYKAQQEPGSFDLFLLRSFGDGIFRSDPAFQSARNESQRALEKMREIVQMAEDEFALHQNETDSENQDIDHHLYAMNNNDQDFVEPDPEPHERQGDHGVIDPGEFNPFPELSVLDSAKTQVSEKDWERSEAIPAVARQLRGVPRRKNEHLIIHYYTGIDLDLLQEKVERLITPEKADHKATLKSLRPRDFQDIWREHLNATFANSSRWSQELAWTYARRTERPLQLDEKLFFRSERMREYRDLIRHAEASPPPVKQLDPRPVHEITLVDEVRHFTTGPQEALIAEEREDLDTMRLIPGGYSWDPEGELEDLLPYPDPLRYSTYQHFLADVKAHERRKEARAQFLEDEEQTSQILFLSSDEIARRQRRREEFYRDHSLKELQARLEKFGLPSDGMKEELVQRLLDNHQLIEQMKRERKKELLEQKRAEQVESEQGAAERTRQPSKQRAVSLRALLDEEKGGEEEEVGKDENPSDDDDYEEDEEDEDYENEE